MSFQSSSSGQSRSQRIRVCCRVRPLLESEVLQGTLSAPWVLTETSVSLQPSGRSTSDRDGVDISKNRELRDRRETVMDAVFGKDASTQDVYDHSFKEIVAGAADGLNGAIFAYGQTSSGKTFSISGNSNARATGDSSVVVKGVIDFALDDLFGKIQERSSSEGHEYLVRMSYCEVYMERVNDLLRKISPQSQNLSVKEDPESHCFYVEGIKEKIVNSSEDVLALLSQAEKRRRVAYTRYNEVSSRSHTVLTLFVECSATLELEEPRITKVGRLSIVDLAGNERVEAGTDYIAESNSINKSLFFLGKVIEKLSSRREDDVEHVPYRDSKLTRLLSVHLGGNSQTGVLVTLAPSEECVEQSFATLRFAQKAATIKCVARPVVISKEQSLIMKQREIIGQLRQQVRELQVAQEVQETPESLEAHEVAATSTGRSGLQDLACVLPESVTNADFQIRAERQKAVQELEALTVGSGVQPHLLPTTFVSNSREVDAIVTALHRSNDSLRKQRATLMDELKDMHRSVANVVRDLAQQGSSPSVDVVDTFLTAAESTNPRPWEPTIRELRVQIRELLLSHAGATSAARVASRDADIHLGMVPPAEQQQGVQQAGAHKEASLSQDDRPSSRSRDVAETDAPMRKAVRTGLESPSPSDGCTSSSECLRGSGRAESSASTRATGHSSPCTSSAQGLLSQVDPADAHLASGTDSRELRGEDWWAECEPIVQRHQVSPMSSALSDCDPIIERCLPVERCVEAAVLLKKGSPAGGPLVETRFSPRYPLRSVGEVQRPPRVCAVPPVQARAIPRVTSLTTQARREVQSPWRRQYVRHMSVRTWRPGDTAYWRGQPCRVVRSVTEEPPCVVLTTPSGSEITTDLCLLSDCPSSGARPLRLAPLADVSLHRVERSGAVHDAQVQLPSLAPGERASVPRASSPTKSQPTPDA